MKRIILIINILLSVISFSYNYPIEDRYLATIIGSSSLMIDGVSKEIPTKIYKIKIKDDKSIPDLFHYAKDFKFSFTKQNKKAPLVFLLAGTGSDYNSKMIKNFERIFYDAGYHVLSISSPMSSQFLISASNNSVPGLLLNDNKEIINVMKKSYELIKNEVKIEDIFLVGYSLGATNAAVVSFLDNEDKFFNFKRIFMINPSVDLFNSSKKLDAFLDDYTGKDSKKIEYLIENTLKKMKNNLKDEYNGVGIETIFSAIKNNNLSEEEKKAFIGLAFRMIAVDLNFISDIFSDMNIYHNKYDKIEKYTKMFEYFKKVNFASFEDYVEKIGYPYYKKKDNNFTMEDLRKESNLNIIEDFLKNSKNIAVVTNLDELILDEKDFEFLKDVFGKKLHIYPRGGHCGNMYYKENVDYMLNYLKNGEV